MVRKVYESKVQNCSLKKLSRTCRSTKSAVSPSDVMQGLICLSGKPDLVNSFLCFIIVTTLFYIFLRSYTTSCLKITEPR